MSTLCWWIKIPNSVSRTARVLPNIYSEQNHINPFMDCKVRDLERRHTNSMDFFFFFLINSTFDSSLTVTWTNLLFKFYVLNHINKLLLPSLFLWKSNYTLFNKNTDAFSLFAAHDQPRIPVWCGILLHSIYFLSFHFNHYCKEIFCNLLFKTV